MQLKNCRSFLLNSVPDLYKTREMCGKVVSNDPSILNSASIDVRLKKLVTKSLTILTNVTFSSEKMGILSVDLNNTNFNDVMFYNPETT